MSKEGFRAVMEESRELKRRGRGLQRDAGLWRFPGPESSPTREADAQEAIEQVVTASLVQARVGGTLIALQFTESPFQA